MKHFRGIIWPAGVALVGFLCTAAHAVPTTVGANRVLGIIEPGTPANEANERIMVNGLLEGWISILGYNILGYNDGAASGTVMGDNPYDPNPPRKPETYTLKYTTDTLIPAAPNAPLVQNNDWYRVNTSDPVIDLGTFTYDWVLAKWGPNSEVYYIGDLTGEIQLKRINLIKGGLSHYTLFNRTAVPDAGRTVALLGLGLLGLGWYARRRN